MLPTGFVVQETIVRNESPLTSVDLNYVFVSVILLGKSIFLHSQFGNMSKMKRIPRN